MNNLPNPKDFKNFKAELSESIKFDDVSKLYDLENVYKSLMNNAIPKGYISKLIDIEILEYYPRAKEILKEFICYSKYDDSLTIVLKDSNEIKTIAIHRTKDKEGNVVKWKTLGSKKYIQYKIKDDFVFVVYGMAEILLCELFDISYIAFQSDSIAKGLKNNIQWQEDIKPLLEDKYLILLLDNDDSCRKTVFPISEQIHYKTKLIPLEMANLEVMEKAFLYGGTLKKEIPIGFDFRDYCNKIKNPQRIEEILKEIIKAEL